MIDTLIVVYVLCAIVGGMVMFVYANTALDDDLTLDAKVALVAIAVVGGSFTMVVWLCLLIRGIARGLRDLRQTYRELRVEREFRTELPKVKIKR